MTEPDIDPRRLLIFREVIREGGLTGAATSLGLTTSAVSQQLTKFEKEAGTPLVTRTRNRIAPTVDGLKLLRHADAVADAVAAAASSLRDAGAAERPTTIRMVVVGPLFELFPLPVKTGVASLLSTQEMGRREAVQAVSLGRADWLYALEEEPPVEQTSLNEIARVVDSLVVVLPRAWQYDTVEDLAGRPWAQAAGLADALFQDSLAMALRAKPRLRHTTSTHAAALVLVREGLAATITTQFAAANAPEGVSTAKWMPTIGEIAASVRTHSRSPSNTAG